MITVKSKKTAMPGAGGLSLIYGHKALCFREFFDEDRLGSSQDRREVQD
jgi:hypothetical protein